MRACKFRYLGRNLRRVPQPVHMNVSIICIRDQTIYKDGYQQYCQESFHSLDPGNNGDIIQTSPALIELTSETSLGSRLSRHRVVVVTCFKIGRSGSIVILFWVSLTVTG